MNDEDLERVLKNAGLREKPPAEVERDVRRRLHAEWRVAVSGDVRRRRQRAMLAVAAGIFAAAIATWFAAPQLSGSTEPIADVALATGEVRVTSGWLDRWHGITEGQTISIGQTLETGPSGRGALALRNGISARLDHGTRLVITATDRVRLERGTLYVDSGIAKATVRLDVLTPSGSVRHVGTQYEVRLLESGVRLRVRDGLIEWRSRAGGIERSQSGEQLTIADDGSVERMPMPVYGATWDWAAAAAPAIEIEGLPLVTFLSWAARELGRKVSFSSAQTAADAADIVVHGSISGLTPAQALEAVLATTSVRAAIVDGRIVIASQDRATRQAD